MLGPGKAELLFLLGAVAFPQSDSDSIDQSTGLVIQLKII